MRYPALQRTHAWLALTATLLLALMPSLGRLMGHAAATGAGLRTAAPHSTHAMHRMDVASDTHAAARTHGSRTSRAPATPHRGHGSVDCDYCLLVAPAPPAPLGLAGPAPLAGGMSAANRRAQLTTQRAPVPTLGSQGPPAA